MLYPELDTPAVLVDLDQVAANIKRMQALADAAGVALRPHTKTHKSPYFAQMQIEAGATGLTCAKLGEAEVLADAGFTDLLIAYPLIGAHKLERLAALAGRARRLIVTLDSYEVAAALASVGARLGRPLDVYLEVDTGQHRIGRQPGDDAIGFARGLDRFPGIRLAGVMSHAGPTWRATEEEATAFARQEAAILRAIKAGLGQPDLAVSVGATPTAHLLRESDGITEMRPGTYIFYDRNSIGRGLATEADCAMRVLTTVVSHAAPDRAVVDAGSKSLAMDAYAGGGHGHVVGRPELHLEKLTEEHGQLTFPAGTPIAVGDRLQIIPNHVCPAINLVDTVYGVRQGRVVTEISIAARGKNR